MSSVLIRVHPWFFSTRYFACVLLVIAAAVAQPARADVREWGIASAHPAATAAGREILAAGGNAFDAAVAVSAALAVVEPYSSGLGGGGFWLLHIAESGRNVMIDGRERAPLAATATMYQNEQGEVIDKASVNGPLAAGIPGEPAALAYIAKRYGKLALARSLAPAIELAREGFVVGEHYRDMARFRREELSPAAAEVFLVDDQVPPKGYRLRQPDLARTLAALARHGRSGFYDGPVAERLVEGVRAAGGIWTRRDLRKYEIVERQPIVGTYRGMKIISASPPSSGGVALVEMLNILSGYDLEAAEPGLRTHLVVEAMRRAYHDRARFLGDTDYVDVPIERLTDPAYAAGRRANLRLDSATDSANLRGITASVRGVGRDTSHFSIIDGAGNRVAATLSINWPFGSGFMPPGTGVILNDEMDDFTAKPGVPNVYGLVQSAANSIAPGKRMLSSMTPTFLKTDERIAVVGTPGGSRIITMVLLAALEFRQGGDAETMVALPRFHHQYLPDVIEFEPGALSESVKDALRRRGHELAPLDDTYGNMHVVIEDRSSGEITAASDPRGNGEAMTGRTTNGHE